MTQLNYFRAAAVSPEVKVADTDRNVSEIIQQLNCCAEAGADLVVFPELSITGYTCADLFGDDLLLDAAIKALHTLCDASHKYNGCAIVVGLPIKFRNSLYNCAAVIYEGKLAGIVPKTHLPNYGEFYERRWFRSGMEISDKEIYIQGFNYPVPFGSDILFDINGVKIGIEICEDLWVPDPVSTRLCKMGAEIIANLSASPDAIGKYAYLKDLINAQAARCRCGYVYASAGAGESSTDLCFSGNCIISENGNTLKEADRFEMASKSVVADIDVEILRHDRMHFNTFSNFDQEYTPRIVELRNSSATNPKIDILRHTNPYPFLDSNKARLFERCEEISSIQARGLATRLKAIACSKAVVGISGGLDSTLALLVTVKAFDILKLDRKGIIGITMPGFGTTGRTHRNATLLMNLLGVSQMEINISEAVKQHFHDIDHDGVTPDVTYENSQARERTQILMDVANKENAIVIGTGDLSELALGWCTYNGDQMSMYAVNASIPKTLVKYLVEGYALQSNDDEFKKVLYDIIDTPISPELIPASNQDEILQKTEDLVGPYELHDFFLFNLLRYGMRPKKIYDLALIAFEGKHNADIIKHWLKVFYRRFFNQQFKRSCMPDGVKVGSVCLSPRGDWRMPSDAKANLWLSDIEKL